MTKTKDELEEELKAVKTQLRDEKKNRLLIQRQAVLNQLNQIDEELREEYPEVFNGQGE